MLGVDGVVRARAAFFSLSADGSNSPLICSFAIAMAAVLRLAVRLVFFVFIGDPLPSTDTAQPDGRARTLPFAG